MEISAFEAIAKMLSRRTSRRTALGRLGVSGIAAVGGVGLSQASRAQEATPPPAGGLPSFKFGLEAAQ